MPSRILFCRELLDDIFGYFPVRTDFDDEDGFGKTEWHTNLINCALACHPLQDPALNVLWSHLHYLDPLLLLLGQWKRMPPKKNSRGQALELNPVIVRTCHTHAPIRVVAVREHSPPLQVLCDDFSPADFQRFQLHARRVVHVDVLNASPIDPAVWQKMSEANACATPATTSRLRSRTTFCRSYPAGCSRSTCGTGTNATHGMQVTATALTIV